MPEPGDAAPVEDEALVQGVRPPPVDERV
jgi:hypothetical protein